MRIIFLFLILLNTVLPVYAHIQEHEEQIKPGYTPFLQEEEVFSSVNFLKDQIPCNGYVRAGYIQTDHSSATALGGAVGCAYQLNSVIKTHLSLYASWSPGVNSENDENIQGEFFNSKQDSYLIVGEAYLTLSYEQFHARLGRQHFDSPHIDSDDLRMIPNLFEAYLLDTHVSDELAMGIGFVREAAGWENGANASQFVSIGEALGGESSGAWLSWLSYQHDIISSDSWFYYIPDHLTQFYSEFIMSDELSADFSYRLGLQYDWGKDAGNAKLGRVDAHTLGILSAITWSDLTLTAAYNKNFGNTGALASVGGGPFFTSVEDQTLDVVEGVDAESILLSVEYHLNDFVDLGVMAGKFSASNKKDYNKEELNVFINFNWGEIVDAEVLYAVVDDLTPGPDWHQVRAIVTYHY